MAVTRWTKVIEITFEEEIPDEELKSMIDRGTYADDLADYEPGDDRAVEYAVTDRFIHGSSL